MLKILPRKSKRLDGVIAKKLFYRSKRSAGRQINSLIYRDLLTKL